RLAAEQGYGAAQFNLGAAYADGKGISKNYIYAHMWFNIAASNGDKEAVEIRATLAKRMTPSQLKKALILARECVAKNYKGC
ncbi:MAG: sel1 repeat family protein, partial [Alphaproteobacteria bacterium]